MRRWLVLATTHLAVLALGFGAGIYALPILTAPGAPDAKALDRVAAETLYAGRFVRDLKGSNRLHWGEGEVRVSRNHIAHFGRLAQAPTTSSISPHASLTRRKLSSGSKTYRAA